MDPAAPFVRSSMTSLEAALAIEPHLEPLEGRVMGILADFGGSGCTDEELLAAYHSWHGYRLASTIRARRIKLVQKGLVEDSGTVRKGASGRNMTVWRVKGAV